MSMFREWNGYFNSIINQFGQDDVFIRFMILWMAYNSYYSNKYPTKNDRECINLLSNDTHTQQIYDSKKQQILSSFAQIHSSYCSPRNFVKDMRTSRNARDAIFDEQHNDLYDFLNAVYQIRCNLFHGDKTPYSETDKELTKWAYENLLIILQEDNSTILG